MRKSWRPGLAGTTTSSCGNSASGSNSEHCTNDVTVAASIPGNRRESGTCFFLKEWIMRRVNAIRWLKLSIEALETRDAPAGMTAEWIGRVSSEWFTPNNWDTRQVPGAGDTAILRQRARGD